MPRIQNLYELVFLLLLILNLVGCGGSAQVVEKVVTVEVEKIVTVEVKKESPVVNLKPEQEPETNVISTEVMPLDNCGGNSRVGVDIERSREFIYVVTDKDGYEFGAEYFLLAVLEKEYNVINGEKEVQKHTIHLETEANSHVVYTIVWKELWHKGEATVRDEGGVDNVPYKVKKGLSLEIQDVEAVDCETE